MKIIFLSDMKGGFLSIIVYSLKLYKTQDMFDNSLCLSHNQLISEGIIFRVGKKKKSCDWETRSNYQSRFLAGLWTLFLVDAGLNICK